MHFPHTLHPISPYIPSHTLSLHFLLYIDSYMLPPIHCHPHIIPYTSCCIHSSHTLTSTHCTHTSCSIHRPPYIYTVTTTYLIVTYTLSPYFLLYMPSPTHHTLYIDLCMPFPIHHVPYIFSYTAHPIHSALLSTPIR